MVRSEGAGDLGLLGRGQRSPQRVVHHGNRLAQGEGIVRDGVVGTAVGEKDRAGGRPSDDDAGVRAGDRRVIGPGLVGQK